MSAQSKEIKHIKMGYLSDGINEMKLKESRIAFNMWAQELINDQNIQLNIAYYDINANMLRDYKEKKIQSIGFNPWFYLQNEVLFDSLSHEYWAVRRSSKQLESYVVLVRNDSNINTIKALKNKKIATRSDSYLGKMFLDTEFLKVAHEESSSYIDSYIYTKKFSTALLKTFFGAVDACVVSEHTLDLLTEMNPNIQKKLKVLKKSEEIFMPMLALFHKDLNKNIIFKLEKNIANLKDTKKGRSIFGLMKIKSFEPISIKKITPLKKYYNTYLSLRSEYVK